MAALAPLVGGALEAVIDADGPGYAGLCAAAPIAIAPRDAAEGYDLPMDVVVSNPQGEPVFRARIGMWVSPKPARDTH